MSDLREACIELSLAAGAAIMAVYAQDFPVEVKADDSPLTQADLASHRLIVAGLRSLTPDIPVLSEEDADIPWSVRRTWSRHWLVDPLDGTREFVKKNGEFTVNIALVRDGAPALGVVYAPAMSKLYLGVRGRGAFLRRTGAGEDARPIRARRAPAAGLVAVASRSHRGPETDAFLSTLTITDFAAAGSSLKFCLIAEGLADVYPRLGRTMEWDTGAGQAVLEAAGGRVIEYGTDHALRYGKKERGFDNPHFIAWGA